ncbi:hypothetical protein AJ80_09902 [Polytolypa hystricis UAMH7299]|uniref:sn-1-specific diacylglycerol lipase n=1 Tax=Polytolypa hystricis (strain UAMH7299) TaxID=1447883 RepID=A0A2B7WH37_POLH7|nr:hypothetical protein AJ80_09902 [Polytolypa hystricis UAMH7299]
MPTSADNPDHTAIAQRKGDHETDDALALQNAANQLAQTSSSTLLPRPVASLVSFFTQSTSLSLRVGTFLGGFALNSARATTLTGLELSRAVVEGILVRAGRDVSLRSTGEYARNEAESILERSLATLHSTITSASFFASASFHLSSVTLSSFSAFSQNLLSTLDAILGSTESSRAIAAIITLIRREFRNGDSGIGGERVGVGDLLVGSIGFALLQRWGRRATEREIKEHGDEEMIWDIVILDNGSRADVVGTQQTAYTTGLNEDTDDLPKRPASFFSLEDGEEDEGFEAVERNGRSPNVIGQLVPHVSLPADRQHSLTDEEIRTYIMNQLPKGARASIRTDTVTSRTITVDVFDHDLVDINPPPGTAVVEERFNHFQDTGVDDTSSLAMTLPKHTVVFRTALNQSQRADLCPQPVSGLLEDIDDEATLFRNNQHHAMQEASLPSLDVSTTSLLDQIDDLAAASPDNSGTTSPISDSETVKETFGKSSLSKMTQKAKSNTEEKLRHIPQLKKISKSFGHSASSHDSPQGAAKSDKENFPSQKATGKSLLKKPASIMKAREASRPFEKKSNTPNQNSGNTLPSSARKRKSTSPKRSPRDAVTSSPSGQPTQSLSKAGYYVNNEESVEAYVAQTDAYSLRSVEGRPKTPTYSRGHMRSSSRLARSRSEKDISLLLDESGRPRTPVTGQRGPYSASLAPSMYSLAATGSETSLLLAVRPAKSAYEDQAMISTLRNNGYVPDMFPDNHLVKNIHRFCCFSSASYGSNFLRVMGISTGSQKWQEADVDHHEHNSFSNHTGLPASTILLSSFVDPAGGSNAAGETAEGFPLVHYLSLDHDSKAVVLTLRGTWGFEDILTDMTCDYDDLHWLGRTWQVHKGMHASARRLLEGGGGRVMATIKAALEEFTDYGVIFCGHSLGGGVAALLATLISRPKDPETPGPAFVTASKPSGTLRLTPGQTSTTTQPGPFFLPPGRPIHVYAYGPPAVMSPSLQRVTRGLITTVVNGQDVVPSLSLGVLHDFHALSLAFKSDISDTKTHIRSRIWENITQSLIHKFYINQPPILIHAGDGMGEDSWAWSTLKSLRESLVSTKLLPPGEVFAVETMRVLQRDAFTLDSSNPDGYPRLGRPATRVQLKFVRDVEARFRELRFGSGMFGDHSPARYEANLAVLARGVLED